RILPALFQFITVAECNFIVSSEINFVIPGHKAGSFNCKENVIWIFRFQNILYHHALRNSNLILSDVLPIEHDLDLTHIHIAPPKWGLYPVYLCLKGKS